MYAAVSISRNTRLFTTLEIASQRANVTEKAKCYHLAQMDLRLHILCILKTRKFIWPPFLVKTSGIGEVLFKCDILSNYHLQDDLNVT